MTMSAGISATDEDRAQLRASLRRLLADLSPEAAVRRVMESEVGHDESVWRRLVDDLGLTSLLIPEAFDGAGYGWRELAVVLEETGAAIYPGPMLSTTIATAALISLADEPARQELLPAIAAGTTYVTFAAGSIGRSGSAACALSIRFDDADHATISGTIGRVLDAHLADRILLVAADGNARTLLLLDTRSNGVVVEPLLGMDLTRRLSDVHVDLASAHVVGRAAHVAEVKTFYANACLMLAAEQLGGAERAFEITLEYLRTRIQFGRQIGSFQAIKHRCADLAVDLESARASLEAALLAADADSEDRRLYAHLAAAACADVYMAVARAMLQLHGGIGFTWEHPTHLYLKRAKTDQLLLGLPATHRRLVAAAAGLDVGMAED